MARLNCVPKSGLFNFKETARTLNGIEGVRSVTVGDEKVTLSGVNVEVDDERVDRVREEIRALSMEVFLQS